MRLFIALELDYTNLIPLKEELKDVKGRTIKENNLHLTLAFLGDTPINKINDLKEIIDSIEFTSNNLSSSFVSTFHSNVIVLKFKKNQKLLNYQQELVKKLESYNFNFDNKKFIPHITLIRKTDEEINFEYCKDFKIKAIHLFSSELTKNGSIYQSLYKKDLFFK